MGDFNRRTVLAGATLAATGGVALAQAPARAERSARVARPGPAGAGRRLRPVEIRRKPRRRSSSATPPTASRCARGSVRRSASPTGRRRSRGSISIPRANRMRRCMCSSTAAPGAAGSPRTRPIRPRPSCTPARITSRSTSTTWSRPRATSRRWPTRCAAPSPGSTATPRASAATRTASIFPGIRPAAHLAGVVLVTDWQKDFGLPQDVVKGGLVLLRHVRPEAGAALGAVELRQVHRRGRARAVGAAPPRSISTVR